MVVTEGQGRTQGQDARQPIGSSGPLSPVRAPLRSQLSSLMNASPKTAGNDLPPLNSASEFGVVSSCSPARVLEESFLCLQATLWNHRRQV